MKIDERRGAYFGLFWNYDSFSFDFVTGRCVTIETSTYGGDSSLLPESISDVDILYLYGILCMTASQDEEFSLKKGVKV